MMAAWLAVLGAKAACGSVLYMWQKVDKYTSLLLLGTNHANSFAQPEDGYHDDDV